jgi:hypothetical protein
MKPLFAIATVSLLALAACKKNEYDNQTNPNAIAYTINGVSDVKISSNGGKGTLPLSVTLTSGTQETVALSLSGMPEKVTASFSAASGTPTYASVLTITSDNAKEGTYPITLTGTSASNVKKTVNFNLVIDKPTDCATPMAGNYTGTIQCGSSPSATSFSATVDGSKLNVLYINNLSGAKQVPATLDCAKGTITLTETISTEPAGAYTRTTKVTGSGTFIEAAHSMNLTVTVESSYTGLPPNTSTCNYTMIK